MVELLLLPVLLSGAALLAHQHQKPPERLSIVRAKRGQPTRPSIPADRAFVDQAAKLNMYGLLLGTVGIEKSQNADLIAFAEKMIQENQLMNVALTSIIQAKEMQIAKALDADQRTVLQQLSQFSGPAFDRHFLTAALAGHQQMIEVFTEETQAAKDKELHRFASDIISRFRTHLQLARKAEASLDAQSIEKPPGSAGVPPNAA